MEICIVVKTIQDIDACGMSIFSFIPLEKRKIFTPNKNLFFFHTISTT